MNRQRTDLLENLVEDVYDAAGQPSRWPQVWGSVVSAFGGTTGTLSDFPSAGGDPFPLALPGYSPEAIQLYLDHFHTVDGWAAYCMGRGASRTFVSSDFQTADEYLNSEIWTDYSRHHTDAVYSMGIAVKHERLGFWSAGIHRPLGAAPFDESDRRDFNLLLPHLRRSLRMHKLLRDTRLRAEIGYAALDGIASAVLVATADGDLVFANAAAEALAAGRDALVLGGRLRGVEAARSVETRALREAIRAAALRGEGGAVQLSRGSGRRPVAALIARLPRRLSEAGDSRGLALVILHDLGATIAPTHRALRELFGATAAEADLALALLAGHRLDEIADQRGTLISTLRSQLSALLARTGTRRQTDLLRLLSRLSPPREED